MDDPMSVTNRARMAVPTEIVQLQGLPGILVLLDNGFRVDDSPKHCHFGRVEWGKRPPRIEIVLQRGVSSSGDKSSRKSNLKCAPKSGPNFGM
jgi:hypothetical protein